MNIPDKVRIGYKDYTVKKVDTHEVDDNTVCYGTINHDFSDICISTMYVKEQQECTFIHECLHGIDDIFETELTEDQVRKLAKGLYSFIKDNPGMFAGAGGKQFETVDVVLDGKHITQILKDIKPQK